MPEQGPMLAGVLLWLCTISSTQAHNSLSAGREGGPSSSSGRHSGAEWRMEATAHIASLVIRDIHSKEEQRPGVSGDLQNTVKLSSLRDWAATDAGWVQLLSSLHLYESSRRYWQQQDCERSLVAVEQSIALKLFPYADTNLQSRWQRSLVRPGPLFRRPKLELADSLILKANGMFELGRREKSIEHLYQALEAIHLSAALMHTSRDLVPEVLRHLDTLSSHVGVTAADILQRMKLPQLQELMGRYGISCPGCATKVDHVEELVIRLALPVEVTPQGEVQALDRPFVRGAYSQQPQESTREYMQRFFSQLVGMVHRHFLTDLGVPCSFHDAATNSCSSYLPAWVFMDQGWDREEEEAGGLADAPLPLPPQSVQHADLSGFLQDSFGAVGGQAVAAAAAGAQGSCGAKRGGAVSCAGVASEPGAVSGPGLLEGLLVHHGAGSVPLHQVPAAPPSRGPGCRSPRSPGSSALTDKFPPHPSGSMNALVDKWVSEGLSADVKRLIASLDLYGGMAGAGGVAGAGGTGSGAAAAGHSSRGGGAGTRLSTAGGVGDSDGMDAFQGCVATSGRQPARCTQLLEQLAAWTALAPPPSAAPPSPAERKLGDPPLGSEDTPPPRSEHHTPSSQSISLDDLEEEEQQQEQQQHQQQQQQQPHQQQQSLSSRFAHMSEGEIITANRDGIRQAVDRQLKEQLDRLTHGHTHDQDDPVVILTLSGATVVVMLAVSLARHRRRVVRFVVEQRLSGLTGRAVAVLRVLLEHRLLSAAGPPAVRSAGVRCPRPASGARPRAAPRPLPPVAVPLPPPAWAGRSGRHAGLRARTSGSEGAAGAGSAGAGRSCRGRGRRRPVPRPPAAAGAVPVSPAAAAPHPASRVAVVTTGIPILCSVPPPTIRLGRPPVRPCSH